MRTHAYAPTSRPTTLALRYRYGCYVGSRSVASTSSCIWMMAVAEKLSRGVTLFAWKLGRVCHRALPLSSACGKQ
jgi:hypothetical protein